MKLNKFLAVVVAATVLPLSVAHAEGPAVQLELPEFKGGVNGEGTQSDAKYSVTADGVVYSKGDDQARAAVHNVPEFKGGVNEAEEAGAEKPVYKPEKATDKKVRRVLPKTHAVK